jgi:RNA polymerase sigma factor (sigma-70 family)
MDHDELLIRQALSGNQNSFCLIVEKYQSLIFSICFNFTKDKQEAEQLVQETFLQAYNSLSKYEHKGFKTWIARIATNKSIDWKRKYIRTKKNNEVFLDDIEKEAIQAQDSAEEIFLKKEMRQKVLEICNQLPQKYSVVLKKCYLQGKTYQKISEEEKISIRTVESRLYRGKKCIKTKWEEEVHETFS